MGRFVYVLRDKTDVFSWADARGLYSGLGRDSCLKIQSSTKWNDCLLHVEVLCVCLCVCVCVRVCVSLSPSLSACA